MSISERKSDHLQICLDRDVSFKAKTTGFEKYELIHNSLPELNADEISTQTEFLGRQLNVPLMISAMTGGWSGAEAINARLGEVCQSLRIGLGVGSQRQIMDDEHYLESFRIVRKKAPDCLIIGNIGGVQLIQQNDLSPIFRMIESIEADAMAVHLNPLQELLQPEGDRNFKGVLAGIENLVRNTEIDIIVKETGCGISKPVARALVNAGVRIIDIAGAGGTSWAAVESFRAKEPALANSFHDWGIPTADSLLQVRGVPHVRVIASGGIRNGVTVAKAIALGAELCGAAMPFLKILMNEGSEALLANLKLWREELLMSMILTGSKNLEALRHEKIQLSP